MATVISSKTKNNYRARVTELDNGDTLITRIQDGTRGPLYTEPLVSTSHAKLTKTTRNWHLSLDVPVSEPLSYVGDCLEDEIETILNYIHSQH